LDIFRWCTPLYTRRVQLSAVPIAKVGLEAHRSILPLGLRDLLRGSFTFILCTKIWVHHTVPASRYPVGAYNLKSSSYIFGKFLDPSYPRCGTWRPPFQVPLLGTLQDVWKRLCRWAALSTGVLLGNM